MPRIERGIKGRDSKLLGILLNSSREFCGNSSRVFWNSQRFFSQELTTTLKRDEKRRRGFLKERMIQKFMVCEIIENVGIYMWKTEEKLFFNQRLYKMSSLSKSNSKTISKLIQFSRMVWKCWRKLLQSCRQLVKELAFTASASADQVLAAARLLASSDIRRILWQQSPSPGGLYGLPS